MTITTLQVLHGSPVTTVKELCNQYKISDRTARTVIQEIEEHKDRYGDFAVLGDGALKRINYLVFTDYQLLYAGYILGRAFLRSCPGAFFYISNSL